MQQAVLAAAAAFVVALISATCTLIRTTCFRFSLETVCVRAYTLKKLFKLCGRLKQGRVPI